MFVGILSIFGILLVANFQETNVMSVHMMGTYIAFVLGCLYCWLHSYLSYLTIPVGLLSKIKFYMRVILSLIATVFLISTFVHMELADIAADKVKNSTTFNYLYWRPEDPVSISLLIVLARLNHT